MEKLKKGTFITFEILVLTVIFWWLFRLLGIEKIADWTGIYMIYDVVPLSIMFVCILVINIVVLIIVIKLPFLKSVYIKIGVAYPFFLILMIFGYCFLYYYAYSGMQ